MPVPDLNRALERLDSSLLPFLRAIRSHLDGEVWLVGGFVRDLVLNRRPYDLDIAVAGRAREGAQMLASGIGGHDFPLDEDRGTFRVTLRENAPLRTVDLATLRGGAIEADLGLRDFTANAMAAELTAAGIGPLMDPFRGLADVGKKTVRMVSEGALRDDPLRLLRAPRLAVELGFDIEPDTASAISALAPTVLASAAERRRDELTRILASATAARGIRLLDELRLLEVLIPEITRARGVSQPERYHHFDVFDHCIESLAVADWLLAETEPEGRMPRDMRSAFWAMLERHGLRQYLESATGGETRLVLTKLATLLHDVSKPETKGADETGRIRFLGHSERGAKVARQICRRFRLGSKETGFVSLLIAEHLRPAQLSQSGAPTERAIFRFFRDLGDAAPACLVLSLADAAAAAGPRLTLSRWRGHVAYISYVLDRAAFQAATLRQARGKRHFVSGDRLIQRLGVRPGPEVGRLLAAIDEAAATGELHTEEEAIELANGLRQSWRQDAPAPDTARADHSSGLGAKGS